MDVGRHRAVRPRYGRLTAVGASVAVVAVALLGSAGGWGGDGGTPPSARSAGTTTPPPTTSEEPSPVALSQAAETPAPPPDPKALPAASGQGKRIVFDQSAQRIWLVDGRDRVTRTYLGSGSVTDNLHPGTYSVYSRSRWAVGVDDSGVMQYFVRFTKGPGGAAIGFHTIPTKNGVALQQQSQLGTPQSHGCIRQRTSDAVALWGFAPVGTTVVVVA